MDRIVWLYKNPGVKKSRVEIRVELYIASFQSPSIKLPAAVAPADPVGARNSILVWKLLEEGRMTVLESIPFRKIENLFRSDLYDPTELVLMDRLKVFPLESRPY